MVLVSSFIAAAGQRGRAVRPLASGRARVRSEAAPASVLEVSPGRVGEAELPASPARAVSLVAGCAPGLVARVISETTSPAGSVKAVPSEGRSA